MKIFLSCDIEGVSGLVDFDDGGLNGKRYPDFAKIMSEEVAAVCALFPSETELFVKDAHMHAKNIPLSAMPDNATLMSGWSGHPYNMVQGLDESFDAMLLVGYHDQAGSDGSPAAHSFTGEVYSLKINGEYMSEFDIALMTASMLGVPTIFVMGDERITQKAGNLLPGIVTIPTKYGVGAAIASRTSSYNIQLVNQSKDQIEQILAGDKTDFIIELPKKFEIEIEYSRQHRAYHNSFFPGCELSGPRTIRFETDDFYEALRLFHFVI